MNEIKRRIKRISAVVMSSVLTLSMAGGMTMPVRAADAITVSGSSGYFYVKVVNDTTGESDTLRVNVTAGNRSGNAMSQGETTTTGCTVRYTGSVTNPKMGLRLNATQSHKNIVTSQDGTVSLLMCDLQFTVPAHTSYVKVEKDNRNNHTFRLADSVRTPITGSSSYTDVTVNHNPQSYTKNMIMALNLYECGLRQGNGNVHSTITLHIKRNSYSVSYDLDGGRLEGGYNTTYTNPSNGRTQKQNPTTALDGGELSSSYTNGYFRVEHPVKTGYTFLGWNITGMDDDTHYFYTSDGAKSTTGTSLDTTRNADAQKSSYIPTSFMNLRKTAGTVTFNALFKANGYDVAYDGNGATVGTMVNQRHAYDSALNLTMNAYTRTGHTFLGWSRNRDAAEPEFLNGESVKNLTAEADGRVTLYAVWVKNSQILNNANILKNIKKIFKVNVIKTDSLDRTKTLNAVFDVYEWSAKLNDGHGAYMKTPSFQIKSNVENVLEYTEDNLGKFKVKEADVEAPYMNTGDEAEISLSDAVDMPFYENTMVEEDRGVFIMGAAYEEGDIVRDSADIKGATFYQARVANIKRDINDGSYWKKLDAGNFSRYARLVKGAGEWNTSYIYEGTVGTEVTNDSGDITGIIFSLRKKDERGSLLSGARFNAYYADDNTLCRALGAHPSKKGVYGSDVNEDGTLREPEDTIPVDDSQTHATLNADGTKNIRLIVREDEAPKNHKKIDDFTVDAHAVYDSVSDVWNTDTITATFSDGRRVTIDNGGTLDAGELTDESYSLDVEITKKSVKGNYDTADLSGAEYTLYEDSALTVPITTVVIGRNGTGSASSLPLKDYWIRETGTPDSGKFLLSDEVKRISADDLFKGGDGSTFKADVTFEENEDSARLNVHKVDDRGNDLNGAEFTLYECPDDVTEENMDDYDYDSVKSVGTQRVTDGYARFKDIPFGEYILVETVVPDGYKKAPNKKVELTVKNGGNSDMTALTVTAVDEEEKARIRIYKKDSTNDKVLAGATFKIFDVTDNSYIMQDVISVDGEGNENVSREEKTFVTGDDGMITTDELSYGTYRIEETEAPRGYLIDTRSVTLDAERGKEAGKDSDGIPYFEVTLRDTRTETWLDKTDITTGEELSGGEYTIEDGNGNTVDSWTGNGKTHKTYGLIPGETYTFTEKTAPEGYTIATPVEFKVNEDGSVTKVEMKDDYNKVELSKRDITTGEELPGAKLELYDNEGKLVESWTSGRTPHRIDRLPVGTYRLVETQAPKGYVVAESITFEVGESNEVQEVVMNDDYTKTRFIKLAGDTGEPLEDCVLQVLDSEGKVIDEWTTDGSEHEINYLTEGETYRLHEVSAPDDYQLADDIEFVAGRPWSDGNSVTENDYNRMDGTSFTDQGGNTVNWDDGKLPVSEPGDDMETETKATDDVSGTDDEDGAVDEADIEDGENPGGSDMSGADTVTITMLDKPKLVSIIKKTGNGDLLPGARLQLLDERGNVLHEWTTGAGTSSVFRLGNGKYTIHEAYAPENYDLADDITFEVTDDTTEMEYVMTDEYTGGSIKVLKTDEGTGEPLEGAEFTLKGENGLTLKGRTDSNGELIFGVRDGEKTLPPQKYTLTETKTPEGHTLLKEPLEITLPLRLTKAEADAMGADTTKAKWDEENEVYRFFDLTYEIKNDATLRLPETGNNGPACGIAGALAMTLITLLYLALRKRKDGRTA